MWFIRALLLFLSVLLLALTLSFAIVGIGVQAIQSPIHWGFIIFGLILSLTVLYNLISGRL